MTALAVEQLAANFGAAPGFRGVTLALEPGESMVLVGPSGVGKTTLLRTIAGFVAARAGSITIAGRHVTRLPAEQRGAVYLHQAPLLFPHLTVFENVAFPLRLRRVPEAALHQRVDAMLQQLSVEGLAGRGATALSGGQRHRVALARAMAARPEVLLLDEPLSSLDAGTRAEVRDAIMEVRRVSGAALLLVTHDLADAGALGSRIAVMLDGGLAQVATPELLFRRPASLAIARFLGFPNELPGEVLNGCFRCALGAHAASLPDGPAVAALAPEALELDPSGIGASGVVTALTWRPAGPLAHVTAGDTALMVVADAGAPPAVGSSVGIRVNPALLNIYSTPTTDVR